ncbi:MAG: hypothetical protein K5771_02810 [Oscillospiraceae bacterium]|nr:hypothetical protein [Oscillospiraceae bacterium]
MSKTRIDYCYANPAGNITILVETAFNVADYPQIASKLLSAEPEAEQVGFIEGVSTSDVSLRMAGGEFCGNAAFSSAAFAAMKSGADKAVISVDFRGIDRSLTASVKRTSDKCFRGTIDMPLPEEISEQRLNFNETEVILPVVRFPGIAHIICTSPLEKGFAEAALKQWCAELGTSAAGIMLLDKNNKTLTPLVYVPDPETLFWESSCASGTCAAAAWLSSRSGTYGTYSFAEPGGTLGAETEKNSIRLINSVTLSIRTSEI